MSDWKNPGMPGDNKPIPPAGNTAAGSGANSGAKPAASSGVKPTASSGAKPAANSGVNKNLLSPKVKDMMMLFGWVAGLVLVASLCWFLTQPFRNHLLVKAVNRVLEDSGDPLRLGEPVSSGVSASFGVGAWYNTTGIKSRAEEGTKIYIFTFFGEGSFFPCAAVVTPGGKVEKFIPLNSYGEKMMKLLSPGILKIYAQRIGGYQS